MVRFHRAALAACLALSVPVATSAASGSPVPSVVAAAPAAAVSDTPGPPDWLRPGVVITYSAGQGTRVISGTSASGGGFSQVRVVAVDRRNVLAVVDSSGTSPTDGYVTAISSNAVILPASDSEYWKNPAVLAGFSASKDPEVGIERGNYPVAGVVYDALTISRKTVDVKDKITTVTSLLKFTYDLKSGLMLSESYDSVTTKKQVEVETTHGLTQLEGVRVTRLPWSTVSAATWKAPFRTLDVQVRNVTSAPGIGDMTVSAALSVAVAQQGSGYVIYSLKAKGGTADAASTPSFAAGGPAVLDPVWMPPSVLAGLRTNQVIDVDPLTKRRITVGSVQTNVVTIVADLSGQHSEVSYDRASGIAMRTVLRQQSSYNVVTTELTVVGRT